MTETERKFYQNSSKSWLSVVRSMETRWKKQLLPSNGNLYHYAGNSPVRYTDPDGRELIIKITRTNFKFVDAVEKDLQRISPAARVDRKNGN